MSKTVALALLNRANTAEQILQVLDSIAQDFMPADNTESAMVSNTPTLEPIAFWYRVWAEGLTLSAPLCYDGSVVIRQRFYGGFLWCRVALRS